MAVARILKPLLVALVSSSLASCGPGGQSPTPTPTPTPTPSPTPSPTPTPTPPPSACAAGLTDAGISNGRQVCQLPAVVTADLTLKRVANTVYRLNGPVYVGVDCGYDPAAPYAQCDAATLTIEPGVTVLANDSTSALVVRRGSRIDAVGSAAAPIVFTSESQLTGSVTDTSSGLWYGVVLLGRAFIADCLEKAYDPRCDLQWGPGFTDSYFGGGTDNESSGALRYVQIRFASQGLRAAGVGGKTTIDHIQVHNSTAAGVATWGGRVNFRYLVITGGEGLNTDHGHRGVVQYLVTVQGPTGTRSLQVDRFYGVGHDAYFVPRTYTRISNATMVQTVDAGNYAASFEGGADFALLNTVLVSPQGCLGMRDPETASNTVNATRRDLGAPVFKSVVMQCKTPFVTAQGGSVDAATVASVFGSGANDNDAFFHSTLTNLFVNGPNEAAVPHADPTPFNADPFADVIADQPNGLADTSFIGAVRDSNDTSFRGWTCNAGYFDFGGSGGSCNSLSPG